MTTDPSRQWGLYVMELFPYWKVAMKKSRVKYKIKRDKEYFPIFGCTQSEWRRGRRSLLTKLDLEYVKNLRNILPNVLNM